MQNHVLTGLLNITSMQAIEENKTFNFSDKIKESTQNNQQMTKKRVRKIQKKFEDSNRFILCTKLNQKLVQR